MSTSLSERTEAAVLRPGARPPSRMGLQLLSLAGGILLWQLVSLGFSHFVLPPPSAVVRKLLNPAYLGELGLATLASLTTMLAGFALAFACAVPLGIAVGRSPRAAAAVGPVLNAFYAIPPVALIPFVSIWFGLYRPARVAVVFLMCFPDILVVIIAGARDIPRLLLDVGRSFGARRGQLLRLVLLPASLPFLIAAMRIGLARAINGMITAELFLAAADLGGLMKTSAEAFDNAGVFAVVILVCLLGLAAQFAVRRLDAYLLHWHGAKSG